MPAINAISRRADRVESGWTAAGGYDVLRQSLLIPLTLAVLIPVAHAGIEWKHDIRAAFDEAEGRGVPLLVYLSRDD